VEWSIEMSAPSSLVRQGWKPKMLKPGDQVTVTAHPSRDGRPGGSFVSATLAESLSIEGQGPSGFKRTTTRPDIPKEIRNARCFPNDSAG
jgi:hypothetical protein